MHCLIRSLTPTDQSFLWEMLYQALYVPIGQPALPREIIDRPELARYVEDWGGAGDEGFLAIDTVTQQSIGAVWLRQFTQANPGYGYVDDAIPELSIAVLPDYRAQGIGTQLLTHLFTSSLGQQSISLSVSIDNPAVRLYQRFGFAVVTRSAESLVMRRYTNAQDRHPASDPMIAPEILAEFGQSKRRSIRLRVASNPNTPPDTLMDLAVELPYEVVENPAFTLLLLEHPRFISQLDELKLVRILRLHRQLPEVFIDQAIQHQSYLVHRALLSICLTEAQIEKLLEQKSTVLQEPAIAAAMMNQENYTDRLKLMMAKSGNSFLQKTLMYGCLSIKPKLPIDLLETLIDHATVDVQILMANQDQMTEALLDRLFHPDRRRLQLRLAEKGDGELRYVSHQGYRYGGISERIQLRLAQNQLNDRAAQILVRQSLARRNWTTPAVLTVLSRDRHDGVRAVVAKLTGLSLEILLNLATDESDVVQKALLKNRSIHPKTLIKMSTHPNTHVRQFVARHPNTPTAAQNIINGQIGK
jgi:GNAT superfamily N-acetyltransferase